jgi:hypothetical protein
MGSRMAVMAFDLCGMAIRNDDVPLPTNPLDISPDTASWLRLPPGQGKGGTTETMRLWRSTTVWLPASAASG